MHKIEPSPFSFSYEELGKSEVERRRKYREYVRGWLKDDAMKGLMDRRAVYGSEAFEEGMQRKHKIMPTVRPRGRPRKEKNA